MKGISHLPLAKSFRPTDSNLQSHTSVTLKRKALPKLTYRNGYYYLTSAQGGTAGLATSHMVVSARSKHITGPWENSPYNPVVHTYSAADDWWSKGHGTLVDDVDGNWWIFYHAYAKEYHTLGRSTLMELCPKIRSGMPG